jgi:lysophospholipase L1-like esterase
MSLITSSQRPANTIRHPTSDLFWGGFVLTDHADNPTTPRFDKGGFSRVACTVTSAGNSLRLVYGNFYYDHGDHPGGDAIRIRASIEYPSGHYILAHFDGEDSTRQATVPPGRYLVTEAIQVSVRQGEIVWVNTNVAPTSGGPYYVGNGVSPNRGEVSVRNTTHDFTKSPAPPVLMAGIDFVFSPLAVVGNPSGRPPKTVAVMGDSIAAGAGDINYGVNGYAIRGWPLRALHQKVGYVYLARTGEGFADIVGQRARYRFELLEHQHAALVEYGRNDMGDGLSRIQRNAIAIWSEVEARGLQVFQTTITCQTSSTDWWISLENQSVSSPWNEATRLAFNDWLRSGAPILASGDPVTPGSAVPGALVIGESGHPVSGLIDNCDVVESARGSGLWRVPIPVQIVTPPILEGEVVTVDTAFPHGVPVGAGGARNNGAVIVVERCGVPFDGAHRVVQVISPTRLQFLSAGAGKEISISRSLGELYVPWTADGTHPSFVGAAALARGLPVERLLA